MPDDNSYEPTSNDRETATDQYDWMDEALILLVDEERTRISEIYTTLERELAMAAIRCNRTEWEGGVVVQCSELQPARRWLGTRMQLVHRTLHAFALGDTHRKWAEDAPLGFNGTGQIGEHAGILLTQDGRLYDENRWFTHKSCSYHALQDVRSYTIDKALALTEAVRAIP